jgi:hypothetical protein
MSFKQLYATLNIAGTFDAPKTAAYSATTEDCVIFCDPTSAGFTVTLPTRAFDEPGKFYVIANVSTSTNAITVATEGSELINGAATVATNASREWLIIIIDGNDDACAVQLAIPA